MTNRILKGLAIAAGTGLAMGFTSGRAKVNYAPRRPQPLESLESRTVAPVSQSSPEASDDEFLNIEPLLDRLERLEERVDRMGREHAPERTSHAVPEGATPASVAAAIADLERRVDENSRGLELLRQSIMEAEGRMTESVASVERRLEQTRTELPALIEPHITARIDGLRDRFAVEIEQAQQRTLEVFERAIEEKISSRIGSIEKALAEQAGSIEALSTRAAETDNNLQRLVTAIEKLCERAQLIAPTEQGRGVLPRPAQFEGRARFESQLNEAIERGPAVPVVRTEEPATVPHVPVPSFTMAGVAKQQTEPKKSFFRSLVVAGFGLIASRFLR